MLVGWTILVAIGGRRMRTLERSEAGALEPSDAA